MKLIDLSQTIAPGMQLFSQFAPDPIVRAWQSHEEAADSGFYNGCTCEISAVQFVTSIGTYVDAPFHFFPEAPTIDQLPLERFVLPGIVIDCTAAGAYEAVPETVLSSQDIADKAVLLRSDWSQYWGQPTYHEYPFIGRELAEALVAGGASLVGMDWLAADDQRDATRPAHATLLGNDVLIIENLTNLAALPAAGFTFHAAPVKVEGVAAFPVRAYGLVA